MGHIGKELKLTIITTGGTIEKIYDEVDGSLHNIGTQFNKLIDKIRLPYTKLEVLSPMSKDSLDMNDSDRKILCDLIKSIIIKNPVIVLHGTDTLVNSANYCLLNIADIKYPLIFTGAMKPLEFTNSDSIQNLTESLIVARLLNPSVYVVFHSQIFLVPNVYKDKSRGTFMIKD